MKIERVVAKTHNTQCHKCWTSLKGKTYTRFNGWASGAYGKDVHLSLCDDCFNGAVKLKDKSNDVVGDMDAQDAKWGKHKV